MDRRSERIGGLGALATAALTLAGAGVEVAAILHARDPAGARTVVIAGAVVALATGLAQLAAVRGMRFALRPPGKVVWAATALGWLSSAMLVLAALLTVYGLAAGATVRSGPVVASGLLSVWALAPVAVWAITTAAAAWKVRRLPVAVRVAGVVFGCLAIVNYVLPLLRALTLLAALVWWVALGVALLRSSRSANALASTPGSEASL